MSLHNNEMNLNVKADSLDCHIGQQDEPVDSPQGGATSRIGQGKAANASTLKPESSDSTPSRSATTRASGTSTLNLPQMSSFSHCTAHHILGSVLGTSSEVPSSPPPDNPPDMLRHSALPVVGVGPQSARVDSSAIAPVSEEAAALIDTPPLSPESVVKRPKPRRQSTPAAGTAQGTPARPSNPPVPSPLNLSADTEVILVSSGPSTAQSSPSSGVPALILSTGSSPDSFISATGVAPNACAVPHHVTMMTWAYTNLDAPQTAEEFKVYSSMAPGHALVTSLLEGGIHGDPRAPSFVQRRLEFNRRYDMEIRDCQNAIRPTKYSNVFHFGTHGFIPPEHFDPLLLSFLDGKAVFYGPEAAAWIHRNIGLTFGFATGYDAIRTVPIGLDIAFRRHEAHDLHCPREDGKYLHAVIICWFMDLYKLVIPFGYWEHHGLCTYLMTWYKAQFLMHKPIPENMVLSRFMRWHENRRTVGYSPRADDIYYVANDTICVTFQDVDPQFVLETPGLDVYDATKRTLTIHRNEPLKTPETWGGNQITRPRSARLEFGDLVDIILPHYDPSSSAATKATLAVYNHLRNRPPHYHGPENGEALMAYQSDIGFGREPRLKVAEFPPKPTDPRAVEFASVQGLMPTFQLPPAETEEDRFHFMEQAMRASSAPRLSTHGPSQLVTAPSVPSQPFVTPSEAIHELNVTLSGHFGEEIKKIHSRLDSVENSTTSVTSISESASTRCTRTEKSLENHARNLASVTHELDAVRDSSKAQDERISQLNRYVHSLLARLEDVEKRQVPHPCSDSDETASDTSADFRPSRTSKRSSASRPSRSLATPPRSSPASPDSTPSSFSRPSSHPSNAKYHAELSDRFQQASSLKSLTIDAVLKWTKASREFYEQHNFHPKPLFMLSPEVRRDLALILESKIITVNPVDAPDYFLSEISFDEIVNAIHVYLGIATRAAFEEALIGRCVFTLSPDLSNAQTPDQLKARCIALNAWIQRLADNFRILQTGLQDKPTFSEFLKFLDKLIAPELLKPWLNILNNRPKRTHPSTLHNCPHSFLKSWTYAEIPDFLHWLQVVIRHHGIEIHRTNDQQLAAQRQQIDPSTLPRYTSAARSGPSVHFLESTPPVSASETKRDLDDDDFDAAFHAMSGAPRGPRPFQQGQQPSFSSQQPRFRVQQRPGFSSKVSSPGSPSQPPTFTANMVGKCCWGAVYNKPPCTKGAACPYSHDPLLIAEYCRRRDARLARKPNLKKISKNLTPYHLNAILFPEWLERHLHPDLDDIDLLPDSSDELGEFDDDEA